MAAIRKNPGAGRRAAITREKSAMVFLQAAERVLREAGTAMHYKNICSQAIANSYITPDGNNPEFWMNSAIKEDITQRDASHQAQVFVRHGKGIFGLAETTEPGREQTPPAARAGKALSYADAAERVLQKARARRLNYEEIYKRAYACGYLRPRSGTPALSLNAAVAREIRERKARRKAQRFTQGGGWIGLAKGIARYPHRQSKIPFP